MVAHFPGFPWWRNCRGSLGGAILKSGYVANSVAYCMIVSHVLDYRFRWWRNFRGFVGGAVSGVPLVAQFPGFLWWRNSLGGDPVPCFMAWCATGKPNEGGAAFTSYVHLDSTFRAAAHFFPSAPDIGSGHGGIGHFCHVVSSELFWGLSHSAHWPTTARFVLSRSSSCVPRFLWLRNFRPGAVANPVSWRGNVLAVVPLLGSRLPWWCKFGLCPRPPTLRAGRRCGLVHMMLWAARGQSSTSWIDGSLGGAILGWARCPPWLKAGQPPSLMNMLGYWFLWRYNFRNGPAAHPGRVRGSSRVSLHVHFGWFRWWRNFRRGPVAHRI